MSEELFGADGCFDAMTTQQLEELLRADAEGTGNLDTDSLFYIMEILAARQEPEARDVSDAYAEFRREYLPRREKKRSGFFRLLVALEATAAVAAVIFFGILITDALGLNLWSVLQGWIKGPVSMEQPEDRMSKTVAITDAEGREVAVGTVSIDRYSICASIEEKNSQEHSYEVSVNYSFYTDNTALANEYWTVIGDPVTTGSESVILQEFSGNGYSNLRSAEVTFRELSSDEGVTQSVVFIRPMFE